MNPAHPGQRLPTCECGATFRSHRDLRQHRADRRHNMPVAYVPDPSHRGPAADR